MYRKELLSNNPIFHYKGRSFTKKQDLKLGSRILVKKCSDESANNNSNQNQPCDDNVEYVIKIITITKPEEEASYSVQLGELKHRSILDSMYNSRVLTYDFADFCSSGENKEAVIISRYRGVDLMNYRRKINNQVSLDVFIQILFECLVGLKQLHHDVNMIHRDIKPDNLFVEESFVNNCSIPKISVTIGDFGISKQEEEVNNLIEKRIENSLDDYEGTTYYHGTKGYIAPECFDGELSTKSDIYSLGITFLQFLFDDVFDPIKYQDQLEVVINLFDNFLLKQGDEFKNGWNSIRNLLIGMVKVNPIERLSCDEIFQRIFMEKVELNLAHVSCNFWKLKSIFWTRELFLLAVSLGEINIIDEIDDTQADEFLKDMRRDRDVVLQAVKHDGMALKHAEESLKRDREIVFQAVKKDEQMMDFLDKSLRNDRDFIVNICKENGNVLKYANEILRQDREIVLKAVRQNGCSLYHAHDSLKKDREIVIEAVKQYGSALYAVDESLKNDREIVLEAVREFGGALYFVEGPLKKDREVVLQAVRQYGNALEYADEIFKKDRDIVLEAVKQQGISLKFADESFKKDKEVVLQAIKQYRGAIDVAEEELKQELEILLQASEDDLENDVKKETIIISTPVQKDKKIMLSDIRNNGIAFNNVFVDFKYDRGFVLEAVKLNGKALEFVDEKFKRDREVVLAAVRQYGCAIDYAYPPLKRDREIALEAFQQHWVAIEYISESLKNDREFMLKLVSLNGLMLQYAHKNLQGDREVALTAVKQDGAAFKYVDKKFKNDREIILQAVMTVGDSFKFADENLKKDKDFVMKIVENRRTLEHVDRELKKDREIVLKAIKHTYYGDDFIHIDETLQKDRSFILQAVKENGQVLEFVDEQFKKDREIVLEAVKQNGEVLKFADSVFTMDREIVLESVKQTGDILTYTDAWKKDREIILTAIKSGAIIIKYIDKTLQNDRDFILELVKQNGNVFQFLESEIFKQDREIVLEALKQNGNLLEYVIPTLKYDRKVISIAFKSNMWSHISQAKRLTGDHILLSKKRHRILEDIVKGRSYLDYPQDRELVLQIIEQLGDGTVIKYLNHPFRKDKEIVLAAIKYRASSFIYADETLKNDKDFIDQTMGWFLLEEFGQSDKKQLVKQGMVNSSISDSQLLKISNDKKNKTPEYPSFDDVE